MMSAGFTSGRPGAQLNTFEGQGKSARVAGARAERATADLLDALTRRGYVVFHSLPVAHGRADIDHVLVGSRGAVLVDSKCWLPGWYLTACSRAWRSTGPVHHFTPAESTSLARSVERMRQGGVRVVAALVATWPSSETGRVHARLLRYAGADAVLPARRAVRRAARLAGRGGADPRVVAAVGRWAEANR